MREWHFFSSIFLIVSNILKGGDLNSKPRMHISVFKLQDDVMFFPDLHHHLYQSFYFS